MSIFFILYALSWMHCIYRWRTGGKCGENGPEVYCCNPTVTADGYSAVGIVFGTLILLCKIF